MAINFGTKQDLIDLNEIYMPAYALTPPVLNGYMFLGWYTSDGDKWNFNTTVTEDLILHARFIPEGFTLLNYIQVNNSYLNLESAPSSKARIIMKVSNFQRTVTSSIFGSKSNNGKDEFTFASNGSSYVTGFANVGTSTSNSCNMDGNSIWTIKKQRGITEIFNSSGTKVMNIEQIGKTFSGTQDFYIGNINNNGSLDGNYNNNGRIYSCIVFDPVVTEDNSMLLDLIPCKDDNNVIGMYDCINDWFFSSATSSSFIGG